MKAPESFWVFILLERLQPARAKLVQWTLIPPVNNRELSFFTHVTAELDKAEKWEF